MKKSKKIICIILICALAASAFCALDYFIEKNNKHWDSGIVQVNGHQISFPISKDEFENTTGLLVSEDGKNGFHMVSLDGVFYEKITVYMPEHSIMGMEVKGENAIREFDEFPGKLVSFPGGISTNSSLEEIKAAYSTGIFDFFKRESIEKPGSESDGTQTTTVKYSGDSYDMSVVESTHKNLGSDKIYTTISLLYYTE